MVVHSSVIGMVDVAIFDGDVQIDGFMLQCG